MGATLDKKKNKLQYTSIVALSTTRNVDFGILLMEDS